ncbi:sulfotransferase 1 family member D1-like [Lingula anatina]|uniref:Sulfotransferase 1 family member D1-like n=1 Tax=Lingula anatina TaxID=7574 RepID=A0A1S3KEK3_LINAN|nr:sulfotransferase 1 family member D1-like [Lingula anatina]|eukprot:XP_013421060.1 sulfotransferase 1 family member D1-like [Lingula anatina]
MTTVCVEDANGDAMTLVEWGGVYFPAFPGIVPRLNAIGTLEFRPDDILLCTYPKCGTQWLNGIVQMLKQNVSEHYDEVKYLEACDQDVINNMPSPRILITHMPKRFVPYDAWKKNIKVIIVSRNPKDVAASFCAFKNACKLYEYSGTWDGFFPLFLEGKVAGSSWFEYTKEWFEAASGNRNCLFLTYEDMKKDLLSEIKKINRFLEYERTDQFLEEVAQQCTFATMKRAKDGIKRIQDMFKPGTSFFRKGEVADWKNWFTVAQNEQFDELYNREMADAPPELKSRIVFE